MKRRYFRVSRAVKIDYVDQTGTEQSMTGWTRIPSPPKRQTTRVFDAATVRVKLEVWCCTMPDGTQYITKNRAEADEWKADGLPVMALYKVLEDA